MQKNKPIISLNNLYSIYNQNNIGYFVAVKNVSYDFEPNKSYFIIGNSGSGKSSLIHHFNGLKPTKYGDCNVKDYKLGTGFDLNGYFIGIKKFNDIKDSIKLLIKAKIFYRFKKSVHILEFNSCTNRNIARIFINMIYNKNPKRLFKIYNFETETKYFWFYEKDECEIVDDCNWAISETDNVKKKLPKHLTLKQTWKTKHIAKVKKVRKSVATVFQFPEYQLFKDQIIKDVIFGPVNLGVKKQVAIEDAKQYLKMLKMPESYYYHSPFGLSGGQKRRVAIAGILAIQPDVIIFDEPTAGLDPAGENEMMDIIENLKNIEKKTVIVISHNMNHVLHVADEVLVMNKGRLVKVGNPYDIFMDKNSILKFGLNLPYVFKIYFDILDKIKDKEIKEKFKQKMNLIRPKTIDDFAKLLDSFFEELNEIKGDKHG